MTGRKIYQIAQAVLCALLAGMLCAAAVSIYREGAARQAVDPLEPIYTREAIAAKFAHVAPVFYAWVGLTAAGLLLGMRGDGRQRSGASRRESEGRLTALPADESRKTNRSDRLRMALILAAVAMIVLGIFNGGARDVLYKAANICTECIGLG